MSNIISRVYSGDTSDVWEVGFTTSAPGDDPQVLADLAGFTCKIAVAGSTISRAVTVKNTAGNRFRAWLTPAETATLTIGEHTVGISLDNLTLVPPLAKEVQIKLLVSAGVVAA